MKKPVLILAAALVAGPAFAQFTGPGARPVVTVLQAVLDKPVDDQRVILRGKIVRQVAGDKYIFSDGKSEIRVEIDSRLFPAKPVTATTLVEIAGEVEKDFLESPEIDVDALHVVE